MVWALGEGVRVGTFEPLWALLHHLRPDASPAAAAAAAAGLAASEGFKRVAIADDDGDDDEGDAGEGFKRVAIADEDGEDEDDEGAAASVSGGFKRVAIADEDDDDNDDDGADVDALIDDQVCVARRAIVGIAGGPRQNRPVSALHHSRST